MRPTRILKKRKICKEIIKVDKQVSEEFDGEERDKKGRAQGSHFDFIPRERR